MKFLILSGSTRKASVNRQLGEDIGRRLAALGHEFEVFSVSDFPLPIYSNDIEKADGFPEAADLFRDKLLETDAFIIASPEYNFSFPGGLKNLIDWASRYRPYPFKNVPTFLCSASPSALGGNRGLWALRIPLEALGALVHPEMFSLARVQDAMTDGKVSDEGLSNRLDETLSVFVDYAAKLSEKG